MKLRHILNESYEIVGVDPDGYLPSGSSKKGTIHDVSYEELVSWFGEPDTNSGEEVSQAFWEIDIKYRDPNGFRDYDPEDEDDYDTATVSIYDWKQGDVPLHSITEWNVGAKTAEHYWVLDDFIQQQRKK